ncbi:unnamed protein product [Schistosoma curassoni]|uniref:Uncharacterized protein n=1 Tax=Schistosoma curassoni TaxID=6186 RepID=A0A3P8CUD3_9TREM|nr:unnamed protein product [Schistosoma curassoni]
MFNFFLITQPLPRQIILHGCFARHLTNTPKGFTDIRQCPLWIRLATDHGLAVSVAHAISSAASKVFASSQSPRRSERPPNLDTSFNESVDRSFLFFPYPTPGRWYLSLYPECYTEYETAIGQSLIGIHASCADYLDIILSHKNYNQRWIVASSEI